MSASATLHLLAGPLAFLLFAAPLAALLDQLGFFAALAERLGDGPRVAGRFWLLATLTVVFVNLDAAVVLLTPLAVRLARRTGRPDLPFAAIPAVLALLASSALPVSNLTNLVVVSRDDLGSGALLGHLGLPTVAAVVTGWWLLRADLVPSDAPAQDAAPSARPSGSPRLDDARSLRVGSLVLLPTMVAFVALPALGWELWPAALAADVVLVAILRTVPWRSLPVGLVLGVPVVALAVNALLDDVSVPDAPVVVVGLVAALAANLVNNLPALLGGLPLVGPDGSARWGLLLGVNAGAGLLLSGSLSSLLWRSILRRQGVHVSWVWFARLGLRVTMPAFVVALLVLGLQEQLLR